MSLHRSIALVLLLAVGAAHPAYAEVQAKEFWVRATAGTGKITAAYGTIVNSSGTPDELIAVSTPVAGKAQIHAASRENGIMKMDEISALDIPGGSTLSLAPGAGHHLMFLDVGAPLKPGDQVEILLTFKNAGPVKVSAVVRPLSSQGVAK